MVPYPLPAQGIFSFCSKNVRLQLTISQTPMQLPANSEVEVSFWRQTDDRKVWYEWLVESYMTVSGQRIRLGVSDLHSSKSNGCMM